jgi:hypothetical protein
MCIVGKIVVALIVRYTILLCIIYWTGHYTGVPIAGFLKEYVRMELGIQTQIILMSMEIQEYTVVIFLI